ncbi:MAG: TonB-dependent receptor [Opitutae bacterium]|nr:TonB-dependent receptor [Opitutae bacterium]
MAPWVIEASATDFRLNAATGWVPRDAWAGRSADTLRTMLGGVPGLIMQESFGGFEPPRLSLRGSGVQSAPSSRGLALLLDGLPLSLADGSFNSALYDPQLGNELAVFRGGDGWRLSPLTMGGALDLRTPASASTGTTDLHAEAGGGNAWRGAASGSAALMGFAGYGAATYARQEGWRANSEQERTSLLGKLSRSLSPGNTTTVEALHVRARYGVPGPLTLAMVQATPRAVSADVVRDQPYRDAEVWRLGVGTATEQPNFGYEAKLAWQHTADFFQQLQANGISDSRSDDLSLRASTRGQGMLAGQEHRPSAQVIATRGWRELRRYNNDSGRSGALFGRDGLYATQAALLLEDRVTLHRSVSATLGIAATSATREIADRGEVAGAAPTQLRLHWTELQPQATVTWALRPELTAFAGVARTAEPPTFDDLLIVGGAYPRLARRSQALALQRATTWEAGVRGRSGSVRWDATVYRANWSNEILRLADARGVARGAVNAGPTRHTGLEAAVHWRLLDGAHRLTFNASGVWTRCIFVGDTLFGENRLAGVPPVVGVLDLVYEHPRGYFLGTGVDGTAGKTPVDHAGRMVYGGQTSLNARAGWRSRAGWMFFVEARNLADRNAIASTAGVLDVVRNPAATAIFLPTAPRRFTVGCEWRR